MTQKNTSNAPLGNIAIWVLVCFFLSGLSGLLYEILWTRMIVKIIGVVPFAVSIVLTVFMAGLGLGSYLAGRVIDRISEPMKLVKIYGALGLIIAAYGLLLPLLLIFFRPVYAILYNRLFDHFMLYNFLTFIGCSVLLCIPVICMGATLPILCRFYVRQLSHLGTRAGALYGLNTIGAALGALLCGFWLINLLGVWGTLVLAVVINCIVGLSCLLAGLVVKIPSVGIKESVLGQRETLQGTVEKSSPLQYPVAVSAALVIFAVSGFCAMAYEVI